MKGLLSKLSNKPLETMREVKAQLIVTDLCDARQADRLCELILSEFVCGDDCVFEQYCALRKVQLARMLLFKEELKYAIYESILAGRLCELYKTCHKDSMRQETGEKIAALCQFIEEYFRGKEIPVQSMHEYISAVTDYAKPQLNAECVMEQIFPYDSGDIMKLLNLLAQKTQPLGSQYGTIKSQIFYLQRIWQEVEQNTSLISKLLSHQGVTNRYSKPQYYAILRSFFAENTDLLKYIITLLADQN